MPTFSHKLVLGFLIMSYRTTSLLPPQYVKSGGKYNDQVAVATAGKSTYRVALVGNVIVADTDLVGSRSPVVDTELICICSVLSDNRYGKFSATKITEPDVTNGCRCPLVNKLCTGADPV